MKIKQKYFTVKNISQKSAQMLAGIKKTFKGRDIDFEFEKSALIVLDMQNYFLDMPSHAFLPSADAIVPNLQKLIKIYYSKKRPVIFTRHENTRTNSNLMYEFWKNILKKGHQSKITKKLNTKNAKIIKKTQYDAFYKTNLEKFLKRKHIKHLLITGVMTHLCLETTARSAFVRGFMPFFPIDTTATYNEQFHKASMLNASNGFAKVDTVSDILGKIWKK